MTDNDRQLERLLRNVEVPDDLKTSLLKIPDQSTQLPQVESNGTKNRIPLKVAGLFALAASLVGLMLFFVNPFGNEPIKTAGKAPIEEFVKPDDSEQQNGPAPTAASLLEQMSANSLELHALVLQQNIELLEALVAEQKSPRPKISRVELASVAMSVANQAGVDYGNDIESVRKELQQVITDYPGTAGANMAGLFIKQTQQSEF